MNDNFLKATEPKLKSINYLMLHNLLPFMNEKCQLCKREQQSMKHFFFKYNLTKKRKRNTSHIPKCCRNLCPNLEKSSRNV